MMLTYNEKAFNNSSAVLLAVAGVGAAVHEQPIPALSVSVEQSLLPMFFTHGYQLSQLCFDVLQSSGAGHRAGMPSLCTWVSQVQQCERVRDLSGIFLTVGECVRGLSHKLSELFERRVFSVQRGVLPGLPDELPDVSHCGHQGLHYKLPHLLPAQLLAGQQRSKLSPMRPQLSAMFIHHKMFGLQYGLFPAGKLQLCDLYGAVSELCECE
jgi:hypothetical protein